MAIKYLLNVKNWTRIAHKLSSLYLLTQEPSSSSQISDIRLSSSQKVKNVMPTYSLLTTASLLSSTSKIIKIEPSSQHLAFQPGSSHRTFQRPKTVCFHALAPLRVCQIVSSNKTVFSALQSKSQTAYNAAVFTFLLRFLFYSLVSFCSITRRAPCPSPTSRRPGPRINAWLMEFPSGLNDTFSVKFLFKTKSCQRVTHSQFCLDPPDRCLPFCFYLSCFSLTPRTYIRIRDFVFCPPPWVLYKYMRGAYLSYI